MKKHKQDIDALAKKLDRYIHKQTGSEKITPEEWETMRKAKKRALRRALIGSGLTGIIFYALTAFRAIAAKCGLLATTHKLLSIIIIAASVTTVSIVTIGLQAPPQVMIEAPGQIIHTISPVINKKRPKKKSTKKTVITHMVGVNHFVSNHPDKTAIRAIAQSIVTRGNSQRENSFSRINAGQKSTTRYLLTGMINDHKDGNFLISIKLIDTKTSKIIDMETVGIENKDTLHTTCLRIAEKLFQKIK